MKACCPVCKRFIQVTANGRFRKHGQRRYIPSKQLIPSDRLLLGRSDGVACRGAGQQAKCSCGNDGTPRSHFLIPPAVMCDMCFDKKLSAVKERNGF